MSRYSFIGTGNFLLRATIAGKYNGRHYEAGQPILYLTDVYVNINFSSIDKVARAGAKNITGSSEVAAATVTVSGIKTTENLQSFLYRKDTKQEGFKTEVKKISSSNEVAYIPVNSNEVVHDIFIFSNNQLVTQNYSINNNKIEGLLDGDYTIFYKKEQVSTATYYFSDYSLPYCAAEIQIKGNIGGRTGEIVMNIDNLLLLTEPELNFNSDDPFTDRLEFGIMDAPKQIELNYYG